MDYISCARAASETGYGSEPGALSFLAVPISATAPKPGHAIEAAVWKAMVLDLAQKGCPRGAASGDVALLVHGYNTSPAEMLKRHRLMRDGLERHGFDGIVVSFDWASDDRAVSYVQDRGKADHAAERFAREVLPMFAGRAGPGHRVRTHIVGHSMGCLVLRDGFDIAARLGTVRDEACVDQLAVVAADVASASLAAGAEASTALYRFSQRVTNYYSQHDEILSMSDAARASAGPRAGRIGLRGQQPAKAVDVYCGDHFEAERKAFDANSAATHTWFFEDDGFLSDLAQVMAGSELAEGEMTRALVTDAGLAMAG